MTRSLCVPFLCALFSLPVSAGSVEFAQWIPWDFLSQELRKSEFSLEEERPALALSLGEFTPVIEGISLRLNGKFSSMSVKTPEIGIEASGNLELSLGGLKIDQYITREFGGNVIRVRIQAQCGPARITINELYLSSLFSLKETNQWLPELSDIHLELPAGSWNISPVRCEGLSGIGEEIETSINEAMKNPSAFSLMIRNYVAPMINDLIREKWTLLKNGEGNWENLRLDRPEENGFTVRGDIPLAGSDEVIFPDEISPDLKSGTPRFFVSQEGFRAIIQDRLRKLVPPVYDLRENPEFRKLLGSKVMQFFAWPDLRRFPSSTPFVLKQDLSSLNLGLKQNGSTWNADISGKGSLTTLIGGSPIDYIVYSMSVSVPVALELKNGNLSFSSGKGSAKLAWSFGYLYQLLYKPDKRIPVNVLTGALGTLVSSKKENVALPRLRVSEKEYQLGNLKVQDQLITMEWL